MKRNVKMVIGMACAAAMVVPMFAFTSCGGDDSAGKVMNVSLNPEVEFVLDADNKVVSVNALNEEGNLVISAEAFKNVEGKSAEEAAKLFVQVSEETGFLLEGNVKTGENELKIAFSGNTRKSKALYDSVKAEIESYVATLDEAITVGVTQAAAITEEALQALVAQCAPYLDTAEMEYAELMEELKKSREETAELYSQELKNAYYDAKAQAFQQAELSVLKKQVGIAEQGAIGLVEVFYTGAIKALNAARAELLKEDGLYQTALASFREKKVEFLNYKNYIYSLPEEQVTQAQKDRLQSIENALNGFETTMSGAVAGIDVLKETVTSAYNDIIVKIQEYSVKVNKHLDEISEAQKTALTNFTTEFENNYQTNKESAAAAWAEMRTKLEAGYTEAE